MGFLLLFYGFCCGLKEEDFILFSFDIIGLYVDGKM